MYMNHFNNCRTCALLVCLWAVLLSNTAALQAQTANASNDWIDYAATYYKIKVANNAIHRLPHSVLAAAGLPNVMGEHVKIIHKGQEIPVYVSTNGIMSDGDYIEFYGNKNDGELDGSLYQYPSWQPIPSNSLFSDTSAYFLTFAPFGSHLRFAATPNDLSNLPAPEPYFIHRAYNAYPEEHYAGKPFSIAGTNKTYADFDNTEGFVSNAIALNNERVFNLATPALYAAAPASAQLSGRIIGRSNDNDVQGDHRLQIAINGNTVADSTYEGYTAFTIQRDLSLAQLGNATTAIRLQSLPAGATDVNYQSVAWWQISYPRAFDMGNATSFALELDNNGDKYLEINNFNGGSAPVLYDIDNHLRIPLVWQDGKYKVFLPQAIGGAARRRVVLCNTDATAFCQIGCSFPECIPSNCQLWAIRQLPAPIQFTDYSLPDNQAQFLIITHQRLRQGAIDQVARYRDYRSSPEGGNYNTAIIDIEQLYDQFAWGIAKHPLAIRNFANYAIDNWTSTPPRYLLLLGKGVSYNYMTTSTNYDACLVPTYGHEASDVMLTVASNALYQPQLATGRVPAHTPEEVRIYLDKLMTYEANFANNCDVEQGLFRKQALHIAGGSNLAESESFLGKLAEYQQIFEDTLLGGKVVYTYNKISEDVIEQADLGEILDKGLAMIMFFGHSAGSYWNLDLGKPENYNNHGKYPFIMTGSCFVGDIYGQASLPAGMAEDYILADGLGAIGFLATASFGFPTWLHHYDKNLHQQFCRNKYGQSVADCVKQTIQEISAAYPNQDGAKITCQEYALVGDPALRIAAWQQPEPALSNSPTQSAISFEPPSVTADLSGFTVRIAVANLGKATADSITLRIERQLPNGTVWQTVNRRIALPPYVDTIDVYLPMGDANLVGGSNRITTTIDPEQEIDESCEANNSVSRELFIFSDLLLPIFPCNYAIVGANPVVLHASTGIPISAARNYWMEIDTTAHFDSPFKQQTTINSIGGVLRWQPAINYTDNTVYYWRAAPAGDNPQWKIHSFIYQNGAAEGYNQSHHGQWAQNDLAQIDIQPTAPHITFSRQPHQLRIINNYNSKSAISIALDEELLGTGSQMLDNCDGGIAFVVFRPVSGELQALTSQKANAFLGCEGRGTYFNQQINNAEIRQIEFRTNDPQQIDSMRAFVAQKIPNGYYVAMYSVREHRWQNLPATAREALLQLAASMGIAQLATLNNAQGFIAFGQKGSNGAFSPYWTNSTTSALNFEVNANFLVAAETGYMEATVGPALSWASLEWQYSANADAHYLDIYGIDNAGNKTLLMGQQTAPNIDLSSIAASNYPYLQLHWAMRDTVDFTPPQLDYWRVWFDRRAELALDAQYHYLFHADTLTAGDWLQLQIGMSNPENSALDGVAIAYNIADQNGNLISGTPPAPQNVGAGQSNIVSITQTTANLEGNYILSLTLNPNQQLPEKYSFNNLLHLPFTVVRDGVNPYIDVTFDGRHITEGELVSANPEIFIRIKDDNPYLPLSDTADFYLALRYTDPETGLPQLTETPIPFNSPLLQFVAPTSNAAEQGNNTADIRLNLQLSTAGRYELIVRAKDRSGNAFAKRAYTMQFSIDPRPMISKLVNYPNPFTTRTHFVFTLTGSEIPQQISIEIRNISGRVVRNIDQSELGDLHIGNNITSFAWDGTDQYGNALANGLYLYRVVTRLDGQALEHYQTAADNFFNEHGWGKMYLLR